MAALAIDLCTIIKLSGTMQIYLPIAEVSVNAFLLLGLGGFVGILSGMFGVGGGFLMTPLLFFIGIPPAGGSWSKFMLMVGTVDSQLYFVLAVLGLSSLLNIYYLLEPLSRGFFRPKVGDVSIEPHPLVVIPPVITALLSLALFFYVDLFADLASLMVAP